MHLEVKILHNLQTIQIIEVQLGYFLKNCTKFKKEY